MLDVESLEISKCKSTMAGNFGSMRKYSAGITLEGPQRSNQPNLVNNNLKIQEQNSEEDLNNNFNLNNINKGEGGSADKRFRR